MSRKLNTGKIAFATLFALVITMTFSVITANPSFAQTARDIHGPPLGWVAHPPIHIKKTATSSPTGLDPTQIFHAYGIDQLGCSHTGTWGDSTLCGSGQTIAIVDAYGYPTAESDLSVFSNQFNFPACTQANHCLVIQPMGGTVRNDQGWALESALDIQWAHAVAPGAKILLVQAQSNNFGDLLSAVDYAASYPGVHQVSMSWGGSEFSSESLYDYHFQVPGVTFFASSGDSGAGVEFPAVSPNVISVGGTKLNVDTLGNVNSETAWSGSGGGVSNYEPLPSYQSTYGITNSGRSVPDVSYNADPNTGVPVYDSYGYKGSSGWFQIGGTSAGSPQWASIISIANTQKSTPMSSSDFGAENLLYGSATGAAYSSNYRDITQGSNGFSAKTGYDLATGVGSPLTNGLVPFISGGTPPPPQPDFTISASPNSLSIQQGSSDTTSVTVTSLNGYSSSVMLSLTGNPTGVTYSFSANPVTPTTSSTLTLNIDSATTPGTYQLTISGTDGTTTHTTTISLTVTQPTVNIPLSVTVTTDQPSYTTKSFAQIMVNATDNSGAVAGASVTLTITGPSGGSSTGSSTTDSYGVVIFKVHIGPNVATGTYTATAHVTASGHYDGTGSTTFTVTK